MTLVQKLLLGGVPTVAAGGTGAWVIISRNSKGENGSLDGGNLQGASVVSGIKVGEDAAQTSEPEDLIRQAGLNCGSGKETGKVCGIGSTGLNVDRDNKKKEGLFPSGADNGNIKFWLSEDTDTYNNKFRFTVIEKPIKLQKKDQTSETITLDRYENYGLVKEENTNKVYLTRKLTAEEGIRKSLGLPDSLAFPTTVSKDPTKCNNNTCEIPTDQIGSVNFEGKETSKTASSSNKVNISVYKVNDTTTFPGGYRFSLQPHADLTLPDNKTVARDVWWDFRIKDPDAENLVLEKVWKTTDELLKEVGLECKENSNTCTINDGSLKIKVGESSIDKGKKKEGSTGTLYLEKNRSGHYEGLRFSVWGGEITIENSDTPSSTLEMKEAEIFHISKEDKKDSSYYLTLKHGVKEMIPYLLGLNNSNCSLPEGSGSSQCTVQSSNLGNVKIHNGTGEEKLTGSGSLSVTITAVAEQDKSKYPFGYKFSLKAESGTITAGTISISNTATDFKIKKDDASKKLYLEKVNGK